MTTGYGAVDRQHRYEVEFRLPPSRDRIHLNLLTPGRGQRTPGRRKLHLRGLTSITNGEDVFTSAIDKKLTLERQIEEDFPDRVITQIYNYLSLGYPSLAWAFDEELAKISRIAIDELRKDDEQMDAKGYVGVPEGNGYEEVDVVGGKCRRWEALRLYVREWARQAPGFVAEGMLGGRPDRRGGGAGEEGELGELIGLELSKVEYPPVDGLGRMDVGDMIDDATLRMSEFMSSWL